MATPRCGNGKMGGISGPFRNNSVLSILSCLIKPENLLMFWHYGMYREQNKESELTFMKSLPYVGTIPGFGFFLNDILLIIRAILYATEIVIF